MLKIENLHVYYGGIHAVKGVSLSIPKGHIVTLIGANGAGKSSTVRTVAGLERGKGSILYKDKNILGRPTEEIVRNGIALSPEGRRILPHLSVEENLRLGAYIRNDKAGIAEDLEWVFSLFPRLKERAWQAGGTLSGGEQQMLAVGRAMMSRPELLMLDEPSLGLAPLLVKEIFSIITKIRSLGTTILLIEQNAFAALSIANYAYILETGSVVLEGSGQELLHNPQVKAAYLG
ncbi:MAG: ABC transporter ATP-binding protein [Deltaproteobacteria bacterium]|jgi:branched-chain amino acid transport system ATP-binding protein|nr:ABC transporter ATP-binding protein [Deltaproteobacteria bacterium]